MKYLNTNLTKYVQNLYKECYKTVMNEIKGLTKLSDVTCSWTGRHNMVKMLLLSYLVFKVNKIPVKNKLFCGYHHTHSKVYMERQRPGVFNTILKENKTEGLTLPNFKT